jgi:hypothetical protein
LKPKPALQGQDQKAADSGDAIVISDNDSDDDAQKISSDDLPDLEVSHGTARKSSSGLCSTHVCF